MTISYRHLIHSRGNCACTVLYSLNIHTTVFRPTAVVPYNIVVPWHVLCRYFEYFVIFVLCLCANAMWIIIIVPCTSNISSWMTDTHTCGDHIHIIRYLHAFDMPIQYVKFTLLPPPKVAWSPRDIQLCLRTIVWDDSAFGGHILASGPKNTHVYKAPYQYEPQMLSTQCALWQSKFGFWPDWHQHQMCTLIGPTVALLTLTTV